MGTETDQLSAIAEVFKERATKAADFAADFGRAADTGDIPSMQQALENYRVALNEMTAAFSELVVLVSSRIPMPEAN
jgi:hypothetical protein